MASIRERGSNTANPTYAVLFRVGGKQTSKTFSDLRSAGDFRDLVKLLGAEKALSVNVVENQGGITINELFEKWIDWKKSTKVTGRTIRDYERDYANSIRDRLGYRTANAIDEVDVQGWVDKIAKTLDPKTVGDRHMILSGMFKFGSMRSRRLVDHNPCLETQLPSKKKKAPKGFTLSEWDAIHNYAAEHHPDADDLLLFLADSGWRFSEATPLTLAAIEDHGDVIHEGRVVPVIFASVLGVHRIDENDRVIYVEGEGKSQAAMRRINLPPESARMIRRRVIGKRPSDLIFTNATGSQWRSSTFIERQFNPILQGAGVRKVRGMGPHFLRHTHVGRLDRAGVSLAKTQRRIGHENISTTLGVYGGMIDNTLSLTELLALDAMTTKPGEAAEVVSGELIEADPQTRLLGGMQVLEAKPDPLLRELE